jgi:hypothetical protein
MIRESDGGLGVSRREKTDVPYPEFQYKKIVSVRPWSDGPFLQDNI